MESILTTVKKLNNVAEDYDVFDMDFIIHINSVFMTLWQMGVGPKTPFFIEDKDAEWTDFIPADHTYYNAVKSYVALKVGMLFDPPSNGTLNASKEKMIAELEWRLNFAAELGLGSYKIPVSSITLDKTSINLFVGETYRLVAAISPSDAFNKNVTWTSSNSDVATVVNGLVTAKAAGECIITVTTNDGKYTATCVLSTYIKSAFVEDVALNHTSYTMEAGMSMMLTATITPSDATNQKVIWSSSNNNVITVKDGLVSALREGTGVITVTTDDGKHTASCVFEVTAKKPEPYYILEKLNDSAHGDWEAGSTAGSQYWLYDHADSLSKLRGKTITHIGFLPGVNSDHTLYVYDVDLSKKTPPTNWTLHGTYVVSDCVKGEFKEVDIDDLTIIDGHTIGIKGFNACILKEEDGSNVIGLPRTSYTSDTATTGTTATNAHWDFKIQ